MNGIDWSKYLAYFSEIKTRQTPLSEDRRREIEELLLGVLHIPDSDCSTLLGTAGGFGNGTEVVVQLNCPLKSGLLAPLADEFAGPLAIRVMRAGKGETAISFSQQRAKTGQPLNGREHIHFQRTLGVIQQLGYNLEIHEWIPGETLEWLRENYWNSHPLSGDSAQEILRQIVVGVLIPSWTAASESSGVLWDIRDANFVVSGYESPGREIRLVYVDTGNLRHLIESTVKRDAQIRTGLSRLRTTMKRILMLAQGKWEGRPKRYESKIDTALEASGLLECLSLLPKQRPSPIERTEEACLAFLTSIREQGLLRPELR